MTNNCKEDVVSCNHAKLAVLTLLLALLHPKMKLTRKQKNPQRANTLITLVLFLNHFGGIQQNVKNQNKKHKGTNLYLKCKYHIQNIPQNNFPFLYMVVPPSPACWWN